MKNKLPCTMSHSLIAEDINSWARGKYIDLFSHPEIKCHVEQLLLHCYSSTAFSSPLKFLFHIKNRNVATLSWGKMANTTMGLEMLNLINVLLDEHRSMTQIINIHYVYQLLRSKTLFLFFWIKLVSPHNDPKEIKAEPRWIPNHIRGGKYGWKGKTHRPLYKRFQVNSPIIDEWINLKPEFPA